MFNCHKKQICGKIIKNKEGDLMNNEKLINIELDDKNDRLIIIDQTKIPGEISKINIQNKEDLWDAIYYLKVRGAPAIGIAAAYGMYLCCKKIDTDNYNVFFEEAKKIKDYIGSSRPTAVNLFWALDRMERCIENNKNSSILEIKSALKNEADKILMEDIENNKKICEFGIKLFTKPGMGVLTHCNAGPLATSRYGTAQGVILMAHERGLSPRVYVDETRPLLQGARLTAFEMQYAGVDATLICDNMAAIVMKQGLVDLVLFGADRIAANGDTANKIGSLGVAILAKHFNIPVYSVAPTSTIDINCPSGEFIHIEERKAEEVTTLWYEKPMAPKGIKVYNPAFDVTDNSLLSGIITEYGILRPPFSESIKKALNK